MNGDSPERESLRTKETKMSTEVDAETRAKANAACGLIEAALKLISAVHTEGPRGEWFDLAEDTVPINRALLALQRKLLNIHDGGLR